VRSVLVVDVREVADHDRAAGPEDPGNLVERGRAGGGIGEVVQAEAGQHDVDRGIGKAGTTHVHLVQAHAVGDAERPGVAPQS
jgi:hypothetical protein